MISPSSIRFRQACPEALQRLRQENETLSPLVAEMLVARGLRTADDVRKFFHPDPEAIHGPFLLQDMDRAVELLRHSLSQGEKIMICGDYDCDGICGTTLMLESLRELGGQVDYHVPDRFKEGYGLSMVAVERCKSEDFKLLITVDNGSSSVKEVEAARAAGIKVIITDHHGVPEVAPQADAFINPQRPDCSYPFKGICGTGVAFKLIQALRKQGGAQPEHLLDLVALATVADVVPLVDENRILVQLGLQEMGRSRRMGLTALMEVSGRSGRDVVDAFTVGFTIGPRLNAAGRMEHAKLGVQLLTSRSLDESRRMAARLDSLNEDRKECERAIQEEIEERLQRDPQRFQRGVIVEWGENWHQGVIGITAGRLAERYGVPTLVISKEGDEAKGSGRSPENVDLYQALIHCGEHFSKFGGHPRAGGFSLPAANLPALSQAMEEAAAQLRNGPAPVWVDGCLTLNQLDLDLVKDLERMEPFGEANPKPTFLLEGVDIIHQRIVGKGGDHLQLELEQVGKRQRAIAFRQADIAAKLRTQKYRYDLRCELARDRFRGQEQLKVQVSGVVEPPCVSSVETPSPILDLRHLRGRKATLDRYLGSKPNLFAVCRDPEKAGASYPQHAASFCTYEDCPEEAESLLLLTPPPSVEEFDFLLDRTEASQLILLFGSHEIERALVVRQREAWTRESAISVWKLLKSQRREQFEVAEVLNLAESRLRLSKKSTMEILQAFQETGAISEGMDGLFTFSEASGQKLEETIAFHQCAEDVTALKAVRSFFAGPDLAQRLAQRFPSLA